MAATLCDTMTNSYNPVDPIVCYVHDRMLNPFLLSKRHGDAFSASQWQMEESLKKIER